jgi:hypothetical protein
MTIKTLLLSITGTARLEKLAHELYEKWVESRADKDYKAWLRVKQELDKRRG